MSAFRGLHAALISVASLVTPGCGSDGVIDLSPLEADGGASDASVEAVAEAGPACTDDGQCAPPLVHCEPIRKVCVECLTNTNCGDGVCEPSSNACVDCTKNEDCEDEELCDTSRWRCVTCIDNGSCTEEGTACDSVRGECTEVCASDADCMEDGEPRCLTASGFCVQCLATGDCESNESCDPTTHRCD